MSVETIINDIRKLTSPEDIRQLVDAVNLHMTYLSRQNTRKFILGDSVKFSDRRGRVVTGTVTKVNQKTIQVRDASGFGLYKVPASMLETA